MFFGDWPVIYTLSGKKGTNSILRITSSNTDRFSFLFTFAISWKFAAKLRICIHTLSTGDTEIDYLEGQQFIISSFQEWANAMARRPSSVCLSVHPSVNFCANCFFSHTNGRIATKLAHDGLQVSVHPGCAQGQGQRSRDARTFLDSWNELLRHWRSGCVLPTFYNLLHTCWRTSRYLKFVFSCGFLGIFMLPTNVVWPEE